ncbi:MAG: hypothetical protein NTV62_04300, partial [Candidatus Gribaldobacteria bacterium]|nr:hypothetical protein [Candidatus Gribaldobacteria bacterium]
MSFYQYRKILFGFILGLMILIVFGFGAQQISAQGCKALGDVCSSASECCSNFNCNGKCCVSSGFSCAFSSDCCSGICA